jgi:pimeloyl-ACP methyl ester carboxylesterase
MKTKLPMPLLALGADHSAGSYLAAHCRLVATNVKEVIITGAGHWVVQEQTAQVQKALLDFFLN